MIERPGVADITAILQEFDDERLVNRVTVNCEEFYRMNFKVCSLVSGNHIESTCQIFDLTDGNITKLMSRDCLRLLKLGAKIAQDYYPETMGACWVVNAPFLFYALYAIVKGFLDERTRQKVRILGSNF